MTRSTLTGGAYHPPGQAPQSNVRGDLAPVPVQAPQAQAPNEVCLEDPDVTLWHGDALTVLRKLPASSVHCSVTSPPFYGLRDYGTGRWEGGDPNCAHASARKRDVTKVGGFQGEQLRADPAAAAAYGGDQWRSECECGARRIDEQIGLEASATEYVENLVAVFRELRRVLRHDGTFWLEIGDSYGGSKSPGRNDTERMYSHADALRSQLPFASGYKAKDLIGIPWRVAFALQADGWWLRSEIIWNRPNPMPESVTDRPTRSHSTVFLLAKTPRYYFDQEAVREAGSGRNWARTGGSFLGAGVHKLHGEYVDHGEEGRNRDDAYGRNVRSVWEIPTQPYGGAHFAVMPEELARRCILAGTSERGVCGDCGAPWAQAIDRTSVDISPWRPSCDCGAEPVPAIVLDPFMGSGTVAHVCRKLGRHAIGIDLNADFHGLAAERLQQLSLFA